MADNIGSRRAQIDAIDDELLRLINRRAQLAVEVGLAKRQGTAPLHDPEREREVLGRVRRANNGPLEDQSVARIFQCVIDESRLRQSRVFHADTLPTDEAEEASAASEEATAPTPARVAFQGECGAFSEEAAISFLGEGCELIPRPTFEALFASIDEGVADAILAPLENSLMGSVSRCYDLLLESRLQIVAEVIRPVSHCLIACQGATLLSVKTIESHPAALAQCEKFFAAHPEFARVTADDTAASVRRVVESNDVSRAAIAGRRAAEVYGATILQACLEDHAENYTRFALLAPMHGGAQRGNKLSLALRLAHRPGALYRALEPFARHGVEMLKIESRPIQGRPWQYRFYLELRAPESESALGAALNELQERVEEVRFFGRYHSPQTPSV